MTCRPTQTNWQGLCTVSPTQHSTGETELQHKCVFQDMVVSILPGGQPGSQWRQPRKQVALAIRLSIFAVGGLTAYAVSPYILMCVCYMYRRSCMDIWMFLSKGPVYAASTHPQPCLLLTDSSDTGSRYYILPDKTFAKSSDYADVCQMPSS